MAYFYLEFKWKEIKDPQFKTLPSINAKKDTEKILSKKAMEKGSKYFWMSVCDPSCTKVIKAKLKWKP